MRVTARTKQETRRRILACARKLFCSKGFEQTTTRDIAETARIASGTLFNYFPTKEALAMAIVGEDMAKARIEFDRRLTGDESLDEALFAHIAVGLRHLTPHRGYVGEVVETAMSPFVRSGLCGEAEQIRVDHMETVRDLITSRGSAGVSNPSFVSMHLYWTLYLGVLAFWSNDESPKQQETLVVLDESMRLFAASLSSGSGEEVEASHATENR